MNKGTGRLVVLFDSMFIQIFDEWKHYLSTIDITIKDRLQSLIEKDLNDSKIK